MNIKIGTTIRALRVKAGITQEKLAGHLGITVQAVSRWESETCYPDLELIPKIANFFRVSADCLLGMNLYDTQETAADYERRWTEAFKKAEHERALAIITDALSIMPKNYRLMLKKVLSLFIAAGQAEDQNSPEKMQKYLHECENLCGIILAECGSERLRCEAYRYMICIKSHSGDRNAVMELADNLPDVKCSRNALLSAFCPDEEGEPQKYRRAYLYELFSEFFYHTVQLVRSPELPQEERCETGKALLRILELAAGGTQYGEFELYLDPLYGVLYECTGEETYCKEQNYHEKRYEALPGQFTYETGIFRGYTFDHEQTIHSADGSAR